MTVALRHHMRERDLHYLSGSGFFRLAWTEWGDPAAPAVVCVHGLTRQGRDFDVLAEALAMAFRVVCVDLPGRGRSDWLPEPAMYVLPTYVAALSHLLAVVGRPVGWVGTSLGGLCGMAIAAAAGQGIGRLVVNDVGPFIPAARADAHRRVSGRRARVIRRCGGAGGLSAARARAIRGFVRFALGGDGGALGAAFAGWKGDLALRPCGCRAVRRGAAGGRGSLGDVGGDRRAAPGAARGRRAICCRRRRSPGWRGARRRTWSRAWGTRRL